jgi:hypothetical protein
MSTEARIHELEQKLKLVEEIIQQAVTNKISVGDLTGGGIGEVLNNRTVCGVTRYNNLEAVIIPIHLLRRYRDG